VAALPFPRGWIAETGSRVEPIPQVEGPAVYTARVSLESLFLLASQGENLRTESNHRRKTFQDVAWLRCFDESYKK
jgi:hypothetical protein